MTASANDIHDEVSLQEPRQPDDSIAEWAATRRTS